MQELAPSDRPESRTAIAQGNWNSAGRSGNLVSTAIVGLIALVAGVAAGALLLGSNEAVGTVDATATMIIRPEGPLADIEEDGNRAQFRDLTLAGELTVTTGDGRELTGEVSFAESEDLTFDPGPMPSIGHLWGAITATLEGVPCEGQFGFSFFASGEGGGSVSLRCEDGSALAGSVQDTQVEASPEGFLQQLTREVTGWYVPAG